MEETKFSDWAILELMGHRRLAGKVSEASIGGGSFIRIDVPGTDGATAFTQFYSPSSVYCISPTTEQVARAVAKNEQPAPVQRWELKALDMPAVKDESELPPIITYVCGECGARMEGEEGRPPPKWALSEFSPGDEAECQHWICPGCLRECE